MRKNWREVRKSHFNQDELEQIDLEVSREAQLLKHLQDIVSHQVAEFMVKENIGFNELLTRMNSNPRQVSKIVKGDCNLTMASIAALATVMGKSVELVFS